MKAHHAEKDGEPFTDKNVNGDSRTWQRVVLTYPDGAVLHDDIDLKWPLAGESVEHYAPWELMRWDNAWFEEWITTFFLPPEDF